MEQPYIDSSTRNIRTINIAIEVTANDDGYPIAVEIVGGAVEALTKRTLTDLAQEGVDSQMGSYGHHLRAVYAEGRTTERAIFTVEDVSEDLKKRFPGNA